MFTDKVVLITGASSGIGAGAALRFAKEGAKLSLTGRNNDNLEDVGKKCVQLSKIKPLLIIGDLTDDKDVKNIIDATIKTYGKLDVLINNAGWMGYSPIGEVNMDMYDKIFKTNVRSVYLLTNLAIPHLIETKGNVVNVSSLAGIRTFNSTPAYCMSKAALDHFTRCAACELAPKKVRVNGINPGGVETNILKASGLDEKAAKYLWENAGSFHPLGRIGNVDDTAEAIMFLASDKASFITGQSLLVDGGLGVNSPIQK